MALTKDQKSEVIGEIGELLKDSKLTVIARYRGTSVKSMQELRRGARDNGTTVRVVKNRLFKKVLDGDERFKEADTSYLTGQLMYAFNPEDEVAPAQALATFAKKEPQVEFVGALDNEGSFMSAEDVAVLASLPSKEQLRAQLVGTILTPLSGFASVVGGNLRGFVNILSARAENLG